ncbi:MAG: hypothetical protein ACR2GK_07395 [Gemmatimonadaceae bacterium]
MRDIVVLFGAGASYGAGGILPGRPPLGAGLYAELRVLYPGSWGSLPADIDLIFERHFEDGMSAVHERSGAAIPQLMREMAIYFAQFRVVDPDSAYPRFLKEMHAGGLLDRVALSTLNYELALDLEVLRAGHSLNYFDPADSARIPLWKLHGSCNMFSAGVRASQGVSYGTDVTFEGSVEAYLYSGRVIEHCLVETGLAPVMSLYMSGKPLNVCPSAVRSIQTIWAEATMNARAVAVVGVRPWPADDHVWGPLAATAAPFFYIGQREPLLAWARDGRTGPTEIVSDSFGDGLSLLINRIRAHAAQ